MSLHITNIKKSPDCIFYDIYIDEEWPIRMKMKFDQDPIFMLFVNSLYVRYWCRWLKFDKKIADANYDRTLSVYYELINSIN